MLLLLMLLLLNARSEEKLMPLLTNGWSGKKLPSPFKEQRSPVEKELTSEEKLLLPRVSSRVTPNEVLFSLNLALELLSIKSVKPSNASGSRENSNELFMPAGLLSRLSLEIMLFELFS